MSGNPDRPASSPAVTCGSSRRSLHPRGLAAFYQELLGFVRVQDDNHWVVIGDAADRPGLAFQLAPDLRPPGWPDAEPPQQMHLDIAVDDLDQAEEQALASVPCGSPAAVRLSGSTGTLRAIHSAFACRSGFIPGLSP